MKTENDTLSIITTAVQTVAMAMGMIWILTSTRDNWLHVADELQTCSGIYAICFLSLTLVLIVYGIKKEKKRAQQTP
jgi:hypothetical protein